MGSAFSLTPSRYTLKPKSPSPDNERHDTSTPFDVFTATGARLSVSWACTNRHTAAMATVINSFLMFSLIRINF